MRLFVAIELPEIVRHHLQQVITRLTETVYVDGGVSWTRPDAFHLTLKFVGEVPDDRVAELADVLYSVSGPEMRLQGTDFICFPHARSPRVIGAAMAGADVADLIQLQSRIEAQTHAAGIPLEGRAYHPHVTLGRIKRSATADHSPALAELATSVFTGPSFLTRQFVLMESRVSREGSQYIPIARYSLHAR